MQIVDMGSGEYSGKSIRDTKLNLNLLSDKGDSKRGGRTRFSLPWKGSLEHTDGAALSVARPKFNLPPELRLHDRFATQGA